MSITVQQKSFQGAVLAKAIINAGKQLGLKQSQIAPALGMHRTAFSRLRNNPDLDSNSKQGELALLVIRIARVLYALTGGDKKWIQHFMHSHNKMTGGVPAEQIATIDGLMSVLRFVDAIRGKL